MLAVGTRHRVHLFDGATGNVRWEVEVSPDENSDGVSRVAMSQDLVASVSGFTECWTLWDAAKGFLRKKGPRHDGTGTCSCKMTKGDLRESLDQECPLQAHTAGLVAVAFSPCGRRLATGGADLTVILWDVTTGKAEHTLLGHTQIIRSISFSANGARLVSGSCDPSLRVWDTAKGSLLRTIPQPPDDHVFNVHFSPTDSRSLSVMSVKGGLKVWDVENGELLHKLHGHRFALFSPNGRAIATASMQRDVQLVDAASGEVLLTLIDHAHHAPVSFAAFSVDGSKLAAASFDGTCRVWDLTTGALLEKINLGQFIYSVSWGRDWALDAQRATAFAMGHHPRLGAGLPLQAFDTELVRLILDYASEPFQVVGASTAVVLNTV